MAPLSAVLLLAAQAALASPSPPPPGEQPVDPYVRSNANAGAKPLANPAVFKAFHGATGLQRISSDFVERDLKDPRIRDAFAAADVVRLKRTFAEQLCYLLDGGCSYSGREMAAAHKGMGLQNADFNAVVENLQKAMDDERVPFNDQNVLLAKLAPMQRLIAERKSPALLKELRRQLASFRLQP